jgi:hypothetical protein
MRIHYAASLADAVLILMPVRNERACQLTPCHVLTLLITNWIVKNRERDVEKAQCAVSCPLKSNGIVRPIDVFI